jgi:hypothetical protein
VEENSQEAHETTPSEDETSPVANEITHEITGQEDCLICHDEGIGQADKVPLDHAGRNNETCQNCHKPWEEPAIQ